jgi:hypothetical protein
MIKPPLPEEMHRLVEDGLLPRDKAEARSALFESLAAAVDRGELTIEEAVAEGERLGQLDAETTAARTGDN